MSGEHWQWLPIDAFPEPGWRPGLSMRTALAGAAGKRVFRDPLAAPNRSHTSLRHLAGQTTLTVMQSLAGKIFSHRNRVLR